MNCMHYEHVSLANSKIQKFWPLLQDTGRIDRVYIMLRKLQAKVTKW